MKGKDVFTAEEADKIRVLIEEKVKSSTEEQKKIRDKIRKIWFYYTDFYSSMVQNGYTVDDFNELIKSGKITII
jgi:hypothetical protein